MAYPNLTFSSSRLSGGIFNKSHYKPSGGVFQEAEAGIFANVTSFLRCLHYSEQRKIASKKEGTRKTDAILPQYVAIICKNSKSSHYQRTTTGKEL
jgi:hypothetical protein